MIYNIKFEKNESEWNMNSYENIKYINMNEKLELAKSISVEKLY